MKHRRIPKYLAAGAVILAATVGLLGLFTSYIAGKLNGDLVYNLERSSQQNVQSVQREIEHNFTLLSSLADIFSGYPEFKPQRYAEDMHPMVRMYDLKRLGLILPDGTAYVDSGESLYLGDREYFQRSIRGERCVTGVLVDRLDQSRVNVYSVPLVRNGEVSAVLFASYSPEGFRSLLQTSSFDDQGYSYIIDSQGNLIADAPQAPHRGDINILEGIQGISGQDREAVDAMRQNMSQGKAGYLAYGKESPKYAYYQPMNINDWWLMTIVPKEVLDSRVTPIINAIYMMNLLILLVVFAAIGVAARKQAEHQRHLRRVAYTDPLTGENNRAYLYDYLPELRRGLTGRTHALLALDVPRFKMFNETLGIAGGDHVLKSLYALLKDAAREGETLVRNRGDEFLWLCSYSGRDELEQRLQALFQKLNALSYGGASVNLNLAVGVYELPAQAGSFEGIYAKAILAKQSAKAGGKNSVAYYDAALSREAVQRKKTEDEILYGLEDRQFRPWFQPKYDSRSGRIVGAEALARWYRPDGEILTPKHFIPLCEQMGLIRRMDEVMFEEVCRVLGQWKRDGRPVVPVSVNLSRAYLGGGGIIEGLKATARQHGLSGSELQLEITESSMVENEETLRQLVRRMHDEGFSVLLDDFGVGYSSLASIAAMEFDVLKIDKSFVDKIGTEKGDRLVEYTLKLAGKLGMHTVAEGVEREEQFRFLKEHRCDSIQGYYFAKPLSPEEFLDLLTGE